MVVGTQASSTTSVEVVTATTSKMPVFSDNHDNEPLSGKIHSTYFQGGEGNTTLSHSVEDTGKRGGGQIVTAPGKGQLHVEG